MTPSIPGSPHGPNWVKLAVQILVLIVVFFGLSFAVWMILPGGYRQTQMILQQRIFQQQKQDQELAGLLKEAQRLFNNDRLILPTLDSALYTYLRAQKLFPTSSEVQSGIDAVGKRYLQLIALLLEDQNLPLAAATLDAATRVRPYMKEPGYASALAEQQQQFEKLERRRRERRAAARAAGAPRLAPLQVFQDSLSLGGTGPKMVVIPAGKFMMGSAQTEVGRDSDEGPQLEVTLASFAIGQTEVSFAEFDQFSRATGRALAPDSGWGRGERPVINVSWRDAREYAMWLSAQTGSLYRLPSEAEWEYAARAGSATSFAAGNCLSVGQATFDDSRIPGLGSCPSSGKAVSQTMPVTATEPNAWGLYEVHGNVREWVLDCWHITYEGHATDGSAWYAAEGGQCGADGQRVLRGGSWNGDMRSARIANRYGGAEHTIGNSFGFRLVRELD